MKPCGTIEREGSLACSRLLPWINRQYASSDLTPFCDFHMFLLKCRRDGGDLLTFGPDSRMLAARSRSGLQLWRDIHSGAKPAVFREINSTASIQFTPDGETLVFDGAQSGTIHLPTNEVRLFPEPEGYRYFSMTPDGQRLIAMHLPRKSVRNHIRCWPLAQAFTSRKPVWSQPLVGSFGGRPVHLPDGRYLLEEGSSTTTPRRYCYSLRPGEPQPMLAATPYSDWFSERDAVSPDGKWLVGQHTNQLRIWDLTNLPAPPLERTTGSKKIFTDVAFHPSGRWLAATSNDESVRFFETAMWTVARAYTWGIGKMVGVAFSPDGLIAAAGNDKGRIVIWDVE